MVRKKDLQTPLRPGFNRHDLVAIDPVKREALPVRVIGDTKVWSKSYASRAVHQAYDGVWVPGIVTRQPLRSVLLAIGFSFPERKNGMRLRVASVVAPAYIMHVRTPFDIFTRFSDDALLREIAVLARSCNVICGVYGSLALQLVTRLPYCDKASDVDLYVLYEDEQAVREFKAGLDRLQRELGVKIDAELELSDGSAVKLAEFCSSAQTMVSKGFYEVRIRPRCEVVLLNHKESLR